MSVLFIKEITICYRAVVMVTIVISDHAISLV